MKMSTRRFEIERFRVISSRPFEAVVAAFKDALGRLDLKDAFANSIDLGARTLS